MVSRIDDQDVDVGNVQMMMLPPVAHEKYRLELTEKEMMEAVGRAAVALFTLLNQTQPKLPPMVNVVFITETAVEPEMETDPEVVETPTPIVLEEKAPAPSSLPPAKEEIKTDVPPKQSREKLELMLESYRQQIRLLSQAVAQERRLLKTQEQIQLIQQLNRNGYGASQVEDPKVDLIKRIAHFEKEIQAAQVKVQELSQALQDNKG